MAGLILNGVVLKNKLVCLIAALSLDSLDLPKSYHGRGGCPLYSTNSFRLREHACHPSLAAGHGCSCRHVGLWLAVYHVRGWQSAIPPLQRAPQYSSGSAALKKSLKTAEVSTKRREWRARLPNTRRRRNSQQAPKDLVSESYGSFRKLPVPPVRLSQPRGSHAAGKRCLDEPLRPASILGSSSRRLSVFFSACIRVRSCGYIEFLQLVYLVSPSQKEGVL